MNTVIMNRIGDVGVFLVFVGLFAYRGSFIRVEGLMRLRLGFFIVGCLTKRAQLPFRRWLPKAMSAPTPVRALVHRRTLVTAGLFLMMRMLRVVYLCSFMKVVFYLGLITMIVAGLRAYWERDLKKLVALRTLSQMGFCFVRIGLGLVFLSFVHIMSHALFKSCLFMQVGRVIHGNRGQQDARGYGFVRSQRILVQFQIFVILMCLCGLFFIGGAVRKELILEGVSYRS